MGLGPLTGLEYWPTATQDLAVGQATPYRWAFGNPRVGTNDQLAPFQDSARLRAVPDALA